MTRAELIERVHALCDECGQEHQAARAVLVSLSSALQTGDDKLLLAYLMPWIRSRVALLKSERQGRN